MVGLKLRAERAQDLPFAPYLAARYDSAPLRLGILTNPAARQNRLVPMHARLGRLLGTPDLLVETIHTSELQRALIHLLFRQRCNVLGINGGDGTIHAVVNALWSLLDTMEDAHGVTCPPPVVLLLNGGTMNMASRAMNTKGDAVRTVQWFQRRYREARLGELQVRRVRLLEAHPADGGARNYGFIFGSELVHNALWMYTYFGEGYFGLARLCAEAALGAFLNTPLWRKYGHLLDTPRSAAVVDGVPHAPYAAAVASTIDLTLAKGLVRTVHVPEGSPGFHTKIVLETDKRRMVELIPTLMREGRHPRVLDLPDTESLRVKGPYTLDGELFAAAPDADVRLGVCERSLMAVHNEE